VNLVAVSDIAPLPWKNGGGVTRELLRVACDDGAGADWGMRISVADIDADGPFSPFPGVTRWFAVIAGAGVSLSWPGRAPLLLRRGAPALCFAGDPGPDCQLLDGSTRDLNVMVRTNWGHASVVGATFDDEASLGHSRGLGLFALRPLRLHATGASALEMPALSLAWADASATEARRWWLEEIDAPAAARAHTGRSGDVDAAASPGYWIRLGQPAAA
jgi:environmental stress-induced protein Ves